MKFFKNLYYFSLVSLLILYIFPGSLIGYLLYGDLSQQPNFVENELGTSINHFIAFFILSILGLISKKKKNLIKRRIMFLIFLSIFLEFTHLIIPYRSFQLLDLAGNLLGCFIGIIFMLFFEKWQKKLF